MAYNDDEDFENLGDIIPVDLQDMYRSLLNMPEEMQAALLSRMMVDQESIERDSALLILSNVADLIQVKKQMMEYVNQGSDRHAQVVARIAATTATLLREANKLMEKHGEKGGERYEPTFTPDSDEFARAHEVIDISIESGMYKADAEQETVDERLDVITEITQLSLDDIKRLDEIERESQDSR